MRTSAHINNVVVAGRTQAHPYRAGGQVYVTGIVLSQSEREAEVALCEYGDLKKREFTFRTLRVQTAMACLRLSTYAFGF